MKNQYFLIVFFTILVFGFLLRIIPLRDNNFYFTVDQGDDAVHVREILVNHKALLIGPETGISGVHSGARWYYFIALGYKLFNGNPVGAVFMVILLNVATTALVMWQIAKKVSPTLALVVGISLQGFWFFYDTSRWAFSPFPLVFLSILLILFLVDSLNGGKWSYLYGIIPVGLAFHTEVAGAATLFLFYALFGVWDAFVRKLPWQMFFLGVGAIFLFFLGKISSEFLTVFAFSRVFFKQAPDDIGTFVGTNFREIFMRFLDITGNSVVPQSIPVSLLILAFVVWIFFKDKKNHRTFEWRFVLLSFSLFIVSYLFFGASHGWRDWHTVYLPPLLFVSLLLMLFRLPKKIGATLFIIVMAAQLAVFIPRYKQYLYPSNDPGLLASQLKVIDWIYQKSPHQGFDAYIFVPTLYGYHWQYLFWWYGVKQYGFVPCYYGGYPKTSKHLFIPGSDFYNRPALGCTGLQFFVIEPGAEVKEEWRKELGSGKLIESTSIGQIKVEMRNSGQAL